MDTTLLVAVGIAIAAVFLVKRINAVHGNKSKNRPPTGGNGSMSHMTGVHKDHPQGNAVPVKTIQPFKKISDYMFSPWNPLTNAEKIQFHDSDNMPRTDYIMPGGGRLVTYGYTNHGIPTSQGSFPLGNSTPGSSISSEKPIHTSTMAKNLNAHETLFHSRLNYK